MLFAALLLLVTGCALFAPAEQTAPEQAEEAQRAAQQAAAGQVQEPQEPPAEPQQEAAPEARICAANSDCPGSSCVNGQCRSLAEVFEAACEKKCTLTQVTVKTNTGETHTLPPGKGSYIAAGAIAWEIARTGAACQPEPKVVPFKITKQHYGKLLSEEFITVKIGETSRAITHPKSSAVLTLKVEDAVVGCG